jgi:hypothetical protein
MFLKYIDFIFVPFRRIHAQWVGIRTTKGNIQAEMRRMKNLGARGQAAVGNAQSKLVGAQGQYQQYQQQAPQQGGQAMQSQMPPMPQMPGQMPQGMPGPPGAPGAPGAGPPPGINPGPPIRTTGFWIFKKKFCTQCNTQLDN